MSEQNEINPYAAPQSETLRARPAEELMKRPASVKWALAMMIGSVLAISILEAQLFAEHGWRLWTDQPFATLQDASRFVACFALLFGGRRPWVFWTTVVSLAFHLINMTQGILLGSPAIPMHDLASRAVLYVAGLLICFHFYRFTFCRPSRTYFRISKAHG